jgi:hypothetical protein
MVFLVLGCFIIIAVGSIRYILIGLSKLNHPMVDNDKTKRTYYRLGIYLLILSIFGIAFFGFFSIMTIMDAINK